MIYEKPQPKKVFSLYSELNGNVHCCKTNALQVQLAETRDEKSEKDDSPTLALHF